MPKNTNKNGQEKSSQLLEKALILSDQQTAMEPRPTKNIQCNMKQKELKG